MDYLVGDLGILGSIAPENNPYVIPLTITIEDGATAALLRDEEYILSYSTDGRLIFVANKDFQSGRIIALEFNAANEQLEQIGEIAWENPLSGIYEEKPIARGIDWILTCFYFYQRIPTEPYIFRRQVISTEYAGDPKGMYVYSYARYLGLAMSSGGMYFFYGSNVDPFDRQGGKSKAFVTPLRFRQLKYQNNAPSDVEIKEIEASFSQLPDIGGWQLVEDFLIPRKEVTDTDMPSDVHHMIMNAKPIVPLELNWYKPTVEGEVTSYPSHGMGFKPENRMIQVIAHENKLFARGLCYMGRAFIIPAVFNNQGMPEDYYLLITNSHGYFSNYNEQSPKDLDPNTEWSNTIPAILGGKLVGISTQKNHGNTVAPLCSLPPLEGDNKILLNGANINVDDEIDAEEKGRIYYDYSSKLALFLKKAKTVFFDIQEEQINRLKQYESKAMRDWICPTDKFDYISQSLSICHTDYHSLITLYNQKFRRFSIPNVLAPITTNPFPSQNLEEELKFSVFAKADKIRTTKFAAPVGTTARRESIPKGDVFKNPLKLSTIFMEEDTHYEQAPVTAAVLIFRRKDFYDSALCEYLCYSTSLNKMVPHAHFFSEPVRDFPVIENGVIGAYLSKENNRDDWFFEPLPSDKIEEGTLDWEYIYAPNSNVSFGASRNPGVAVSPFFYRSQETYRTALLDGFYPTVPVTNMLFLTETSSLANFFWNHPQLGTLPQDCKYEKAYYNRQFIRHFCKDFVTRYDGRQKSLSTIAIIETKEGSKIPSTYNLGNWSKDRLFVLRIDLIPDEFDFDEEMKRSKRFW